MSTKIETRTSRCEACTESIEISVIVGQQRWNDVTWTHSLTDDAHPAVPELRFAIDATCPRCGYPEIGFAPSRGEFVCSRCGHAQTERPSS